MIFDVETAARKLARGLAAIGLGTLLVFAATTIADGLLRFFLASPIDAVRDLGGLVAAFAVACCIPLAIIERSSITIRVLTSFISPRALITIGLQHAQEVVLLIEQLAQFGCEFRVERQECLAIGSEPQLVNRELTLEGVGERGHLRPGHEDVDLRFGHVNLQAWV